VSRDFWHRQWQRFWSLPLRDPSKFTDTEAIKKSIATDSEPLAGELLAQAREIYAAATNRAEGVERRATTLLGTVGIAASLSLAGASLLLDSSKIHGQVWRLLVAVTFLLTTISFLMCGWRALQALSRLHVWSAPNDEEILSRRDEGLAGARSSLAASMLKASGANEPVAEWKVAYLAAASWWFLRALLFLMTIALILVVYVAFGSHNSTSGDSKSCRGERYHCHMRRHSDQH
jgi:hypothetical protein